MKKITVSVGIAAYNSEKNIKKMLKSLISQKQIDFKLNNIIIHSDNSTDNTVQIAKIIKSKKIVVIDSKERRGFAGSVKYLLEKATGDVVILFNDDIGISDSNLINKLIQPFLEDKQVGLVCGHPIPLSPKTFIESAAVSSFKAYDRMRTYLKDGNSTYSCDGKIMAFSKKFISVVDIPTKLEKMGNTDAYIYLLCIYKGFKFRFVKNAKVNSRMPQTFSDLIHWYIRNNSNRFILERKFGKIVDREYAKPPFIFWRCMLYELVKNPFGCVFIFFASFYIAYQAKIYSKKFNPTWEVISTSKNL